MSFNDPWDFRPNFSSEIPVEPATRERNIQWLDAMSRKYHAHLPEEEHLRRARNQKEDEAYFAWLVSEVSARTAQAAVDRYRVYCVSAAPDNTLMWSHYAASHTGICLEFACRNKVFGTAIRVQYLSRYPAFDLFDNADDTILLPWLTKSDAWSYEQEFRVIAQEKGKRQPLAAYRFGGLECTACCSGLVRAG